MGGTVALDWDVKTYHLDFDRTQLRATTDHESVAEFKRATESPITLEDCLQAFSKEEELGKDELWCGEAAYAACMPACLACMCGRRCACVVCDNSNVVAAHLKPAFGTSRGSVTLVVSHLHTTTRA